MMNMQVLIKFGLVLAAFLASVIISFESSFPLSLPIRSVVVKLSAFPLRIKKAFAERHWIPISFFGVAIPLANTWDLADVRYRVPIKLAVLVSFFHVLRLKVSSLLVVLPLEGNGSRAVSSLYSEIGQPRENLMIANREFSAYLTNAQLLYNVEPRKKRRNWLVEFFFDLCLPNPASSFVGTYLATTIGSIGLGWFYREWHIAYLASFCDRHKKIS